jgi:pyruvate-formate lyase-activating enzyme
MAGTFPPLRRRFRRKRWAVNEYESFGWREDEYLAANPDVKAAVERGIVRDGYHHYLLLGRFRGNAGGGFGKELSGTTRLCLDPWINAEFTVEGELKPCCNYFRGAALGDGADVAAAHNDPLFREVRHRLLSGDLSHECTRCHIREKVPTEQLIADVYAKLGDDAHLLEGGKLQTVRVDVTQECNLRCVYCALSAPWAKPGKDMSDEVLAKVARFIDAYPNLQDVGVNGHGETTHHPRWREFCEQLLAQGAPLSVITNLGRRYDEAEIDTLSRFTLIQISLDTADEELLKRIRRKVDLSRILANMTQIRLRALLTARRAPVFAFSCGLYDKSISRLDTFAGLAVTMGVRNITFWDLMKYPDVPGAETVRPLRELDDDELRRGLATFDRAMAILKMYRINVTVAGNFIDPLRARLAEAAGVA